MSDTTQTTDGPFADRREAFQEWRMQRPFWGGLLLLLGGPIIVWFPLRAADASHLLANDPLVAFGAAAGMLVTFFGVATWLRPEYSTPLGLAGLVLSSLALFSMFGGLLIGTLFGSAGGLLAFAWQETDQEPADAARPDQRGKVTTGLVVVAAALILFGAVPGISGMVSAAEFVPREGTEDEFPQQVDQGGAVLYVENGPVKAPEDDSSNDAYKGFRADPYWHEPEALCGALTVCGEGEPFEERAVTMTSINGEEIPVARFGLGGDPDEVDSSNNGITDEGNWNDEFTVEGEGVTIYRSFENVDEDGQDELLTLSADSLQARAQNVDGGGLFTDTEQRRAIDAYASEYRADRLRATVTPLLPEDFDAITVDDDIDYWSCTPGQDRGVGTVDPARELSVIGITITGGESGNIELTAGQDLYMMAHQAGVSEARIENFRLEHQQVEQPNVALVDENEWPNKEPWTENCPDDFDPNTDDYEQDRDPVDGREGDPTERWDENHDDGWF